MNNPFRSKRRKRNQKRGREYRENERKRSEEKGEGGSDQEEEGVESTSGRGDPKASMVRMMRSRLSKSELTFMRRRRRVVVSMQLLRNKRKGREGKRGGGELNASSRDAKVRQQRKGGREVNVHNEPQFVWCDGCCDLGWVALLVYLEGSLDDGGVRGRGEGEVERAARREERINGGSANTPEESRDRTTSAHIECSFF